MRDLHDGKKFGTEISQVPDVLDFAEAFLEKAELIEEGFEIQLAIEEWYVNVVKHAFGGKNEGTVELKMEVTSGVLTIEITDNGPEFDPHCIQEPEKPKNVEEAKIGGLGIFFIRKLMDETKYLRENGNNTFTMKKKVGS